MKRSKDRKQQPRAHGEALVDDAAERLATIVAAAERAAEQVIDDAEARAREILAAAEAEAARLRADLLETIDRAARELGGDGAEAPAPAPARPSHLTAVASDPEPDAEPPLAEAPPWEEPEAPEHRPEPLEVRGTAAGARLLATQMAVSGSSREEIEERLRNGFEIEDTAAILDAILGPED